MMSGQRHVMLPGLRAPWIRVALATLLLIQVCTAQQFSYGDRTLNRFIVDSGSNNIYIGAVNSIFILDSNLALRTTVSTGPVQDSATCTTLGACPDLVETDNHNKVLIVHNDTLLTCGSVRQGTCERRALATAAEIKTLYTYRNDRVLASNTADVNYETVAFLATGPKCSSSTSLRGNEQVLYTALSFKELSPNSEIEFLSTHKLDIDESRLIDDYLEFAGVEVISTTGTYSHFLDISRDGAERLARSGFSVGKFSYVTFVSVDAGVTSSRIAQVCHNDCKYNSYVEVPIQCASASKQYNLIQTARVASAGRELADQLGINTGDDVIVASFRDGDDAVSMDDSTDSAICVYSLAYVRSMFTRNIQACFDGSYSSLGSGFIGDYSTLACSSNPTTITDNYCPNEDNQNGPLQGQEAIYQAPVMTFSDVVVTSLAVDVVDKFTVAYMGTKHGHLYQAEILTGKDVYSDVTIESGAGIKADMQLVDDSTNILVMTPNKLYKEVTSECGAATSCDTCRQLKSPYCGWCSLEARCTRRDECQRTDVLNRWTSYQGWCVAISGITPQRAPISDLTPIEVVITSLPVPLDESYICVFTDTSGSYVQSTPGSTSGTRVRCTTPLTKPQLGNEEDHLAVEFAIRSSETGVAFLKSTFTFYSCSVHDRCSLCAGAEFDCKWCSHDNVCRNEFADCARGDLVQTASLCPSIVHTDDILVPHGVPTAISIDAQYLVSPLQGQGDYECEVHLGEPSVRVPATRTNANEIVCDSHTYTYSLDVEVERPSVVIWWNNDRKVEIRDALNIEVYKCHVMGRDCSKCQSLMTTDSYVKYDCAYCNTSRQCVYRNTCLNGLSSDCPPPEITDISPLSGPIEGGTKITITGKNLGTSFDDVASVVVGGRGCQLIEEDYIISVRIVCTVASVSSTRSADIYVTIQSMTSMRQKFALDFTYKDPQVTDINPEYGPKSGGTMVTLMGQDLDTGNAQSVFIDNVECDVMTVIDTRIICLSSGTASPRSNLLVRLSFDDAPRRLETRYSYKLDPLITSVEPLKSFLSGGLLVTVKGAYLDVIQQPRMFINDERFYSNCTTINAEELSCLTPDLTEASASRRRRQSDTPFYSLGFILDGVEEYFANSSDPGAMDLQVFNDPVFFEFNGGRKTYVVDSDSLLEIGGSDIDSAAVEDDFSVLIGSDACAVKTISPDFLFCTPPKKKEGSSSSGRHLVVVSVGNVVTEVGDLEYEFKKSSQNDIWIIIVVVGGSIMLMALIVTSVIYKRKKTHADRQYKKLQMQLDTLESNVRNECKQAFAELQTEITDFTSDINVIGIPFWDYKTYTFKVLFPSHGDHPVLHTSPDYKTNKFGSFDQGIHQFSQLLNSKQFMLIFIRTLEQQKNFSIRDKAVVASLLMIVLQDKMEYATEILKSLLEELIDRSVENKHPKLMLRRTESVVEKMLTNWLSIAMYGYVKKQSGKPLFMLYQAIKRQTEKGPVDAISSEARYSLSEDRLLREKIEPNTLTINLVQDGQKEPVTCKCLDCDTITQAKQKALDAMYLNMPFTNRPSVHDVDLEWRSGKSGHLPLQDEDVTTEVVSGWKKVNTLAHYHVPDGAVMALVSKRHKTEGVRQVHGRIEICASGLSGIQPIVTMEEGQKVWHLVKHDDGIYISRSQKVISEIFLTRLLATKGTLQQYIDDLFMTILRVDSTIPPAIKWLFDLLDNAAKRHNIVDPDVVHTWKSNSLPLRFWVNIIKNPDFVFDINKSHICDSCLSVIAQTFMDACSTMDHKLGKDSPSNKLLFAKDIPRYRGWVSKFYKGIQDMAPVTDTDINEIMTETSLNFLLQHYTADFNVSTALRELFKYAHQYSFELLENLDEDPSARKLHLANMFEQVTAALDTDTLPLGMRK